MSCPVCDILNGVETRKGELCEDCEKNNDIKNQWEWYKMVIRLRFDSICFICAYWILIVVAVIWVEGLFTSLFLSALWIFNVWLIRKNDYTKRIAEKREKLFLMKVRGNIV